MPWKSQKQERWGNSPAGVAKIGQEKVNEFNQASTGLPLPDAIKKHPNGQYVTSYHEKLPK